MALSLKHLKDWVGLRIAHISDLHFSKITLSPTQFFSKRFIGNFHALFKRKKQFIPRILDNFAEGLKKLHVHLVIVTGDFSSTGREVEFAHALDLINAFERAGLCVLKIPGNHDHYTKRDYRKKLFYDYFDNEPPTGSPFNFNLKDNGIEVHPIGKKMWWIGLDTACPAPLTSARGVFSKSLEERLATVLKTLPSDDLILLANHYPLSQKKRDPARALEGSSRLRALLKKHPNVKIYLHGHDHKHCLLDRRDEGLPICSDSGSCSMRGRATWNLIDLTHSKAELQVMNGELLAGEPLWKPLKSFDFTFSYPKVPSPKTA